MTDLVAVHDKALAATARIVAGIDLPQLSLPTPCEDFDVRALLEHVVGGNPPADPGSSSGSGSGA